MNQFVEIQICQQSNCKRFITKDKSLNLVLRCPNCYNKLLEEERNKTKIIKETLLKKKRLLEEQLNLICTQNKDIWDGIVQFNINKIKLQDMKNNIFTFQCNVNNNKKKLSSLQEQLEYFKTRTSSIKQETDTLKNECEQQQNLYHYKEQQIAKREHQLKKRRSVIFCQLPFLLDNHLPFQFYRINEEIVETIYDDFLMMSAQSFISNIKQSVWKKDVCLTLKKGIDKWEDFFLDNQQYYENFIYSIINVYKLIYYLGNVFDIVLPYIIYLDNHGFPQFLLYEIFQKQCCSNFINFRASSLTHMQINIYYLKYYINADLQDKIYSFFDIIDLLQSFYDSNQALNSQILEHLLAGYCAPTNFNCQITKETKGRRKPIPIKLVEVENPKFITQITHEEEIDSDDVEIINF